MKISGEYKKEDALECKQAIEWMLEGTNMILDLIKKEEAGQEVTRIEKIEARAMLDKGTIAIEEFNKFKTATQVNNMNRQQKRNFKKKKSNGR